MSEQLPIPITPETPPQFPCWLWHEEMGAWHRSHGFNNTGQTLVYGYTYWHPDSPTAPTMWPRETTGKGAAIVQKYRPQLNALNTVPAWAERAAEEIAKKCMGIAPEHIATTITRHVPTPDAMRKAIANAIRDLTGRWDTDEQEAYDRILAAMKGPQ